MRTFLIAALLVALPCAALAGVTIAPSGGTNIMIVDGPDGDKEAEQVGDFWTAIEVRTELDSGNYLGIVGFTDADEMGGAAIRYWYHAADDVFPGVELNFMLLDEERKHVDELTMLVGGAVLVEMNIPGPSGKTFPVRFRAGASFDVVGSDVTLIPLDVALPHSLFSGS